MMPPGLKRFFLNGNVVAIAATLLLLLLLHGIAPAFRGSPPILLFTVGVVLASWLGGFRSGLLATVLSGLASTYFLAEPYHSLQVTQVSEQLRIALFAAVGVTLSLIASRVRQAEQRALREAINQKEQFEGEVQRRQQAEVELNIAYAELLNERNRLEAVMEALPVGVSILDTQGGAIRVNQAFDAIWGGPRPPTRSVCDYAAYKAWWVDTGRAVASEEWAAAIVMRTGEPAVGQVMRIARFDGTELYVQNSAAPVSNSDGQIVGSAVAIMDITDSINRQQALRESEERFRLAIEAGKLGTWDWDLATNQSVWNAHHATIFGYEPDKELSCYQTFADRVHPEDLPNVEATLAEARDRCMHYALDFRLLLPGAEVRWVSAVGDFQYDPDGKPVRMLGVLIDVTSHKKAEESLRRSRDQLTTFVHQAPVSIAMFDRDMNYLATSGRWLKEYGRGHDHLIGLNHYQVHPDLPERWKSIHRQGQAGASRQNDEDLWIQADGSKHWLRWAMLPWTDEAGTIGGIIIACDDITDSKESEDKLAEQAQQLREADRRKDEFLAMLAHELRNPLAPIRNAVQILKSAELDATRLAWCSNMIDRQVEHLIRLVDDLLDVSRISRGKIELRREALEIRDIVNQAVEANLPQFNARRQEFSCESAAEPLHVDGDRVRLTQVISNLLDNAAKYTAEGGRIGLSVAASPQTITIRVADSGCGIDPAALPRVFDIFYQVDRNLDHSKTGMGIGLSLVHRLVAMHGGEVTAFSAGRGHGSEFVVRLPRLNGEGKNRDSVAANPPPPQKGLRVLVVDDNRDAADSLSVLLKVSGHSAQTAHDGPSAVEMARTLRPDVVLLDLGMPGMDGFAVAQSLRQCAGAEPMRLIALTGYGQPEDRERSRAAGFDQHLVKPANIQVLRKLLEVGQTE